MEGTFENTTYDEQSKKYLKDAYDTITRLDLWHKMREDPGDGGYIFSNHEYINTIGNALKFKEEHSGTSFGWMMRVMQRIGIIGWDKFMEGVGKVSKSQ